PTGVFVPNPEGQRENAQAAGNVAASAAASASASPFEFTGQLLGGAVGGAVVGGAASRALRGTPGVGAGAPRRGPLLDNLDVRGSGTLDEFVSDTRAQTGRFRRRGGESERGGRDDMISGEDIDAPDDRTAEIARQQYQQSKFEVEQRFGEEVRDRVPERPTRDGPGETNDIGSGIAGEGNPGTFGIPGESLGERTRRITQQKERYGNVPGADLRDVTDFESGAGATSRFSSTGAGAGGVGSVSQTTDPTGIAPDPTVTGGPTVGPVNDPTSIASTTAVTGTQEVDPASDPTGIDPSNDLRDQFGGP
ncbi:hypothetical protein, partial [Halorubrum sp. T3]|uniref:hypothetical protein n=1 Tax=Halorubrum sp. T3 TaxID=1194088 RepID=UPI00192CAF02